MKKKLFAATMAMILVAAGAAFAAPHHTGPGGGPGMGPGGGAGKGMHADVIGQAPKNVQDAFKQVEISRSEMRLEIAKGNTDSKKLTPLHNNIIKARRTVADYFFDQALKNPAQARMHMNGHHQRMGMRMMGGSLNRALFADLQRELSSATPNTARAKQIYTDMMNLSEKHSKERFELMLKYPESMNTRRGMCGL